MALTKKMTRIIVDVTKKEGGRAYGSLISEELKGGIIYKYYFELFDANHHSEKIAYTKLVYPSKQEIIISPLPKLKEAFEESQQVALVRYEFLKKLNGKTRYLYMFKVGDSYFDLSEKMAKDFTEKLDISMNIQP